MQNQPLSKTHSVMNQTLQQEFLHVLDAEFTRFEKNLNGHTKHGSHQGRKEAVSFLRENGLPGIKSEEYKYTHISRKLPGTIVFPSPGSAKKFGKDRFIRHRMLSDLDAYHVAVINGVYVEEFSDLPQHDALRISGFGITDKSTGISTPEYLGTLAAPSNDPFIALNSSFYTGGLLIEVAKNKIVDRPVIVHHIYTEEAEHSTYNPRVVYNIGDGAQADIVEVYHQLGEVEIFVNLVEEIFTGNRTLFNCFKIQTLSSRATMVDNTRIDQKKDGVVNTHTYTFDGSMIRNNLHISLSEPHCETHMYGLYATKGTTHVDNHTAVDHIMPDSFSNEIYKGILDENSTGIFNGKIFVRQDAQKTNAFQSNKNVLLSDKAKVNTKPQLEIWADDVKCSHGCTTGQIDEEQLFYLRSRGIPERKARILLLHAFAADVLENVKLNELREMLDRMVTQRLH
jgi:Fe-S cluster assembly protein SufD